jgi:AraC-like DNA-binding protein
MPSDVRAQQAREHHRAAADDLVAADRHRTLRNQLVRQLRAEDPERWTYPALATAVGCSPELIAAIIQERVP